jgi:hypothetical protein
MADSIDEDEEDEEEEYVEAEEDVKAAESEADNVRIPPVRRGWLLYTFLYGLLPLEVPASIVLLIPTSAGIKLSAMEHTQVLGRHNTPVAGALGTHRKTSASIPPARTAPIVRQL